MLLCIRRGHRSWGGEGLGVRGYGGRLEGVNGGERRTCIILSTIIREKDGHIQTPGAAVGVKCTNALGALGREGAHYINSGHYPVSGTPKAFHISRAGMRLIAGETAASFPLAGAPTVMAGLTMEPRFSGRGMMTMVTVPISLHLSQRQLLGCELSCGVL